MDRLFEVADLKPKPGLKSVRALKGHNHLYQVNYGTNTDYIRSIDPTGALRAWAEKHPALRPEDGVAREVLQEDLDRLSEVNPKLLNKLRQL